MTYEVKREVETTKKITLKIKYSIWQIVKYENETTCWIGTIKSIQIGSTNNAHYLIEWVSHTVLEEEIKPM